MSTSPVVPVPATPAVVASPKPLTAIQTIEQEILSFLKQREQAIANVHAVDGAIQAAQHILAKLKQEAAKAEAAVKAAIADVETEAKKVVTDIENEAKKL